MFERQRKDLQKLREWEFSVLGPPTLVPRGSDNVFEPTQSPIHEESSEPQSVSSGVSVANNTTDASKSADGLDFPF